MVRENMRSPRAVFQQFYRLVRTTLQGGSYSGSTPGLAPTLRDVTVLFFRLLLKKTVLSQSEGHLNLLNPRPRGGTSLASEMLRISTARVRPPTCVEYGHTT